MFCINDSRNLTTVYRNPSRAACVAVLEDRLWDIGGYDIFYITQE